MELRIFGTITSPFVRRVRIVALELGVPHVLVDTNDDDGQRALRERTPLWKVPIVEVVGNGPGPLRDGALVFDSRTITEALVRHLGPGPLRADHVDDLELANVVSVVDGALDSLINTLYLSRDGVTAEQAAYVRKQHDRAAAAMAWLEDRIDDRAEGLALRRASADGAGAPGLPEIALATALGWMQFRKTYPIERHPRLWRCFESLDARDSFTRTRPTG